MPRRWKKGESEASRVRFGNAMIWLGISGDRGAWGSQPPFMDTAETEWAYTRGGAVDSKYIEWKLLVRAPQTGQ